MHMCDQILGYAIKKVVSNDMTNRDLLNMTS